MSKLICVAQSIDELKFILKNSNEKDIICLPVDLSVQIYCLEKKLKFINPLSLIKNNFHKKSLIYSDNLIKKLKYGDLRTRSQQKEYIAVMRFRLNSIMFLIELINQVERKFKIKKILVSGWNSYEDQFSKNNYFISDLIINLIKKIKIKVVGSKKIKLPLKSFHFKYFFEDSNIDNSKKLIFLTNIGYNFSRIIKFLKIKNINILTPDVDNLNFWKKKVLNFLNVTFIKLKKKKIKKKKKKIPNIRFNYGKYNLSKLLNYRKEQEMHNFVNLIEKSKAIDKLFEKNNISLVASNVTKGIYGYYLDSAIKHSLKTICIPHGTLSKPFNRYDSKFKNIISEAVTHEKTDFMASQSKISDRFLKYRKFKNMFPSGNLIFSENFKNKIHKNNILYAVTLKDFESIQYLGTDMYYEFIENLKYLNLISQNSNLKIYVKLHPAASHCFFSLKKMFKYLSFTQEKIQSVLSKVSMTISFSSTVIEDSLNSRRPVILFDRWRRYRHCLAEKNVSKKNSPIYYVNSKKSLIQCIKTIQKSNNIYFNKFIYQDQTNQNISKLFSQVI